MLSLLTGCKDKPNPESFAAIPTATGLADPAERIRKIHSIRHTDLQTATKLASETISEHSSRLAPKWKWRLASIHSELLIDNGLNAASRTKIEQFLRTPIPPDVSPDEAQARLDSIKGYLAQRDSGLNHRWEVASSFYKKALLKVDAVDDPCWRAELRVQHQAQVLLHFRTSQDAAEASALLHQATSDASVCPDKWWEAMIPLVEGNSANDSEFYYEKAVAAFERSLALADLYHLPQLKSALLGNLALAYLNLGDFDQALRTLDRSDEFYQGLKPLTLKQMRDWGEDKGHRARIYFALKRYPEATRTYQEAIEFCSKYQDPDYRKRFTAELTALYIEEKDYKSAEILNQQLLQEVDENDFSTADAAKLNSAQLARLEGDLPRAERDLDGVQREVDKQKERRDPRVIWQLHIERAEILARMNKAAEAQREFRSALATADSARNAVKEDEYRLMFFQPLRSIYVSFIDFLATHNQPEEALQVAEQGRARLLAEKLRDTSRTSAKLDIRHAAGLKKSVVLSYSTGPERSYLWATTPLASKMFVLPGEDELRQRVMRHNEPILDERAIAEDQEGRKLFDLLIGPASALIPQGGNVIVIPDGPLSDLNFETLIPPGDQSHYWLESAVVTVAPSLSLLLDERRKAITPDSVLALGAAVQARQDLPQLGDGELKVLAGMYGSRCVTLKGAAATPSAFLKAHPEKYDLIHLSAHAIPNEQRPLESYLVLSPEPNNQYRLYGYDLSKLHLNAQLVTLSACQSAAARNLPGEGLVGLAWSVLSAGARNVVASLWSVPAEPTGELMKGFYTHLHAGEFPDQALHAAKQEVARKPGSTPYQWAAFQLYSR